MAEIKKQPWPTNIRGLQNAVKQMMTNCEGDIVNPIDFKNYLNKVQTYEPVVNASNDPHVVHEQALKDFEMTRIIESLKKCKTRSEAAIRLGLPMTSLLRKIDLFKIEPNLYLSKT